MGLTRVIVHFALDVMHGTGSIRSCPQMNGFLILQTIDKKRTEG
jgi:hypothetical protein